MDRRGYEMTNIEAIEFDWDDPDQLMDAVLRRGRDTSFAPL